MLSKSLLLALLVACGAHSNPAAEPDGPSEYEPPEADKPVEDQHFCCKDVGTDTDGKIGHGDGCVLAEKVHIAACNAVLYCPGGYTMKDGVVTCPL